MWSADLPKSVGSVAPMTGTLTLTDFLRARLDEDETAAQRRVLRDPLECPVCGEIVETYVTPATVRGWKPDSPDRVEPCGHELTSAQAESCHRTVIQSRVLAEVEAKRRIVELHEDHVRAVGEGLSATTRTILRHLALPYADHPDYQPEWRP